VHFEPEVKLTTTGLPVIKGPVSSALATQLEAFDGITRAPAAGSMRYLL
jgi:hypothetical protein